MKLKRKRYEVYAPMIRKNFYITDRQERLLKMVRSKIDKPESIQIRDALDLYFAELGF